MFPRLGQNLQGGVVGYQVFVNKLAGEVEFRLSGGWKADLDLFEPNLTSNSKSSSFSFMPIGIGRAWLPSLKSTLHQWGTRSIDFSGQVRSGKSMVPQGLYFVVGLFCMRYLLF